MSDRLPIRVVIADDQAIVRSGLGAFVMAYDQLQLVGEAKDGEEAIELCEMVQPDVVLMDLEDAADGWHYCNAGNPAALAKHPRFSFDELQR